MKKKRFTEEQIVKALKRIESGEKQRDVAQGLAFHRAEMSALYF